MIATMDRILVVGRKAVAKNVLNSLQGLGVVHIDPVNLEEDEVALRPLQLSADDQAKKDRWDGLVAKLEALQDALGVDEYLPVTQGSETPMDVGRIEDKIRGLSVQVDELLAERGKLRDELDVINSYLPTFREVAPSLSQLEDGRYLTGIATLLPDDDLEAVMQELSDAVEGRIAFSSKPHRKGHLLVTGILKSDRERLSAALGPLGLAELRLPERFAGQSTAKAVHSMEERAQVVPERLEAIAQELDTLGEKHGEMLKALHERAKNQANRFSAMGRLAEGKYGFALEGWIPSQKTASVVEALEKQFDADLVVETREADEHHDKLIPVMLENPNWVKPFEGLLSLFAPPKYGTFDPSFTIAIFFPFYFGIVVGDIGYGLMFLAIGLWMRARGKAGKPLGLGPLGITIKPKALPVVGTVINWCAAWSILFGIVYGEFFGNFLEKFPASKPIFYTTLHHEPGYGIFNILLFRVEVFTPLLLASLAFGIIQVLGGWGIRIYYGRKHHDMKHVYEGIGMIFGLSALIILGWAFLTNSLNAFWIVLIIAGLIVFLACMVLSGVYLMVIELFSNAGNILSFLRLFAVGLSAGLVATLATDLGFALGETLPIIGPILGILIGLSVHLIALALTIIGHTLQPLRLQYVEFFTKFGFYDESGRAYQPFRFLGGKA